MTVFGVVALMVARLVLLWMGGRRLLAEIDEPPSAQRSRRIFFAAVILAGCAIQL